MLQEQFFKGVAVEAFDGHFIGPFRFQLTAVGRIIKCFFKGSLQDHPLAMMGHRVLVSALAKYNGKSGLPKKLEIIDIKPIKEKVNFLEWQGQFSSLQSQWCDRGMG